MLNIIKTVTTDFPFFPFKDASEKEVMEFPRKSSKDYIVLENPFKSLTAFTISMWFQVDETPIHCLFSYAQKLSRKPRDTNAILIVLTETEVGFRVHHNKTPK